MSTSLVFNDASLPFCSLDDCHQHLPSFFDILRLVTKNQAHIIRVSDDIGDNWYKINYADNFSLSQWVNKQSNIDYKRYLKGIMDKTQCPLIPPEETNIFSTYDLSSFNLKINNKPVRSLGGAFLLDMTAVSCFSMPHWKKDKISIIHEVIDEETNGIKKKINDVRNISRDSHLQKYLEKIICERLNSKSYLSELKQTGNTDFPNLIFCDDALDGFKKAHVDKNLLMKILDAFKRLNSEIVKTNKLEDFIKATRLTISGESQSTRTNPKLMKDRRFKMPDGTFTTFDLHVKNFPSKRLYIHPDMPSKKVYLGYFGKHLRSTRYPT